MERSRLLEALRWVGARPRVLPLTALLLRARTVRPSSAFMAREALHRATTHTYRLRSNGLRVAIRHRTGDVVTLGEIFHEHDYLPIGEVQQAAIDVSDILDLGANIGLFGALACALWPRAQVVAFEPDPANADVHERTIALNQLQARWQLVRAAAANHNGTTRFVAGEIALSHVADPGETVETIEVPVVDVMGRIARADIVKMDIEGGEWPILEDARFRKSPPRAIVLEYHPRLCSAAAPRAAAESLLSSAGLQVRSIWHRADGHGMLWAWQS